VACLAINFSTLFSEKDDISQALEFASQVRNVIIQKEILLEILSQKVLEIVLEMNVSSVAHAMRGLQKKHSSPIQSQRDLLQIPDLISSTNNLQYNLHRNVPLLCSKDLKWTAFKW
jgi:hypothetical protein